MDRQRINKIVHTLNNKNVTQPCPRCSTNKFSVIGESEIIVSQPPAPSEGLLSMPNPSKRVKISMPTIIVTCDNCGYISQHAQASLGLLPKRGLFGLEDV